MADREETCAYGIEMDVVHHVEKSNIALNYEGLVAILEDVTPLSGKSTELIGKFGLQPVHAVTEVGLRCSQAQMIVIAHQNISMQIPLIPFAGFEHNFCKSLVGFVCHKQAFPVISPVDNMVPGSLILHSCCSRHRQRVRNDLQIVNTKQLGPSPFRPCGGVAQQ